MQGFKYIITRQNIKDSEKSRNSNKMIGGINVYNYEERGEISSLERKRLEGIIIEVSKTLMNTEKGETGNDSKAKKDINRKEQRTEH